jgi:catechol 2,3-dioxygenase-like lactoylglutathione lyase family enzyme
MIDHVAINVGNISESAEWYKKNLDFKIDYIDESWAMLSHGNTKLALALPDYHPPHIAIRMKSLSDFPDGEIRYHRDGSAYLYRKDPDGNVIEYIRYPPEVNPHPSEYIHLP